MPGVGTQSSRMVFTHEGSRLVVLDSFSRSMAQYDVVFNRETHLNNVKIAHDKLHGPAITEGGTTNLE